MTPDGDQHRGLHAITAADGVEPADMAGIAGLAAADERRRHMTRAIGGERRDGGASGRASRLTAVELDGSRAELEGRENAIDGGPRSEEHTSELQSLMRSSYAVFCLKKKKKKIQTAQQSNTHDNTKQNVKKRHRCKQY